MAYSTKTLARLRITPKTLGSTLGLLAVRRQFSVIDIAKVTGASRQTVYNWFDGGEVLAPYQPLVKRLITILKQARTAEEAWKLLRPQSRQET